MAFKKTQTNKTFSFCDAESDNLLSVVLVQHVTPLNKGQNPDKKGYLRAYLVRQETQTVLLMRTTELKRATRIKCIIYVVIKACR